MEETGQLRKLGERYEFHFSELGLVVRGSHPEWVLEAAAEIITDVEQVQAEGHLEELKMLTEMGEANEMDLDDAKFTLTQRFETVPQCIISMGATDYHWVSKPGRSDMIQSKPPVTRLHDMSLTRNNSFLQNEPGAKNPGDE
ncbi:MAG: hypothetical protein AAF713_12760 [Pseudomonadota bacterium]